MTNQIPDHLPLLATGSHERGTGMACIMNAISYLNGDITITDAPDCTYRLLARAAIDLNDTVCKRSPGESALLCPDCSHQMWLIGARIIGTAEAVQGWSPEERQVLDIRLAVWSARQVLHHVRPEDYQIAETALLAAKHWLTDQTATEPAAEAGAKAYDVYSSYVLDPYASASAFALRAAAQAACAVGFPGTSEIAQYPLLTIDSALAAVRGSVTGVSVISAIDGSVISGIAVDAVAAAGFAFVNALIDEFERLTGTTSPGLPDGAYETVAAQAGLTVVSR